MKKENRKWFLKMNKKASRNNWVFSLNRRSFLKGLGLFPLLPLFSACQQAKKAFQSAETDYLSLISPINRALSGRAQPVFTGDDFTRPHHILWNKSAYINSIDGLPKPKRKEELVIIGGGMSGLMSAYMLRDKKPLILEQARRFGGNAKSEAWNGLQYSIGAAYLVKPEQDSALYKLLSDLGIVKDWTIKSGGDGHVVINGKLIEKFWEANSEPEHRATYKKLYDYFMSFINEGGNVFPDYPTDDVKLREYINKLDQEDYKSHLERIIGVSLPSNLATLLEHYCFSSLGGSSTEISAAAGINFFAAEFSDIAVFPGGNAYIAEALLKNLHQKLPANHLLPGCLVFDVRAEQNGILISYVDANNQAQSILAEKVIMSCPKFVAAKLIDQLPSAKLAAIAELEYRAYLVANLLINRPIKESDYDLYWLGAGKSDFIDVAAYARNRGITDIINANFSSPDPLKTVLSFYQAFPYHGGRSELYTQNAYADMRAKISAQIKKEIYPFYQLSDQDIVDLRLTRWGHPLPLAAVGLLDRGVVDTLRAPIDDRIYFIEQDNWALPAIETVVAESVYWSSIIR
jgi:protoporphyrinogen oxidase